MCVCVCVCVFVASIMNKGLIALFKHDTGTQASDKQTEHHGRARVGVYLGQYGSFLSISSVFT